MDKFCSVCKKPIADDVYNYSMKHYSRALCREHQPNQTKSTYTNKKKPEPTPEALRLGNLLKNMGYKVEFEKYDGFKHIDIAIVDKKVNIEVDGMQHQGTKQALRDLKRTYYSWNKNFVTLRIPNSLTKADTIEETAKYIDKFLKKDKGQLEKEIKDEYVEEGNPFWEDVNNFVNGVNNIINNVSGAVSSVSKTFNSALKKFK